MGALNALIVLVVSALTMAITLTVSFDALKTIGQQHAGALADGTIVRIDGYMQQPEEVADTLKNWTGGHNWDTYPSGSTALYDEYTAVVRALFLRSGRGFNSIHTFFMDGTRISFLQSTGFPESYIQQNQRLNATTNVVERDYKWFWRTNHTQLPTSHWTYQRDFSEPADIRTTGLFDSMSLATFGGTQSTWGSPSVLALSSGFVSYFAIHGAPLRIANNSLYGYATVSLSLDQLDGFLRTVPGTPNTYSFAVDASRRLLGSSHPTPYTRTFTIGPGESAPANCEVEIGSLLSVPTAVTQRIVSCRLPAVEFSYAPLRAAAEDREFLLSSALSVRRMKVEGDSYYVATGPINLKFRTTRVQLVMVMPEKDVIGEVVVGRNLAIGISVGILFLAAIVGAIAVSKLLAPLNKVADRMSQAASLEDSQEEGDLSPFDEIYNLQTAYYEMNGELNRIRSFVPQSLLQSRRRHSKTDLSDPGQFSDPGTMVDISDESFTRRRQSDVDQHVMNSADARSAYSRGSGGGSTVQTTGTKRKKRVRFAAKPLVSDVGLRAEFVTVVSLNLADFHLACRDFDQERLTRAMSETVNFVQETITAHKGVLERFNGDHFTITFNAVRPCMNHPRRAAMAAHMLASKFRPPPTADLTATTNANRDGSITEPSVASRVKPVTPSTGIVEMDPSTEDVASNAAGPTTEHFQLTARIGVASGRAYVGNLGTSAVKSFNIIGSALTHAVALERLAKLYRRRSVLVPQRIFLEVGAAFELWPIDVVALPGGRRPVVIGEILRRTSTVAGGDAAAENQQKSALKNSSSKRKSSEVGSGGGQPWVYRKSDRKSRTNSNHSATVDGAEREPNDISEAAHEYARRRAAVFLAVADGRTDVAERHFAFLLEEASKEAAGESHASDFGSSATSIAHCATPKPGESPRASAPPYSTAPVAEAQLNRLELASFLETSDLYRPPAPAPADPNSPGDGAPLQPAGSSLARRAPAGMLHSPTDRNGNVMPNSLTDPSSVGTTAERVDLNAFLAAHVGRVPTVVSLMRAARAGAVGKGLGVFWDVVHVGLPPPQATYNVPPMFAPPAPLTPRGGAAANTSLNGTVTLTLTGQQLALVPENGETHAPLVSAV